MFLVLNEHENYNLKTNLFYSLQIFSFRFCIASVRFYSLQFFFLVSVLPLGGFRGQMGERNKEGDKKIRHRKIIIIFNQTKFV